MTEECENLVADPLRWRSATRPQVVFRDCDVGCGRGRRDLALGRRDETDAQGFGQVADAGEETGRMRRAIELQTGEIVVMHPLVQQRLEKDLGGEYLLPNRRQVVDPDGAAPRRRLPCDPVVPIGFDL